MYAKKSLGQNFLNSQAVIKDIVKAASLQEGDLTLEIGPGKGILTRGLLKAGAKVIAIEKDDRLIPILAEKFTEEIKSGQLAIIHGDILEPKTWAAQISGLKKYKLVANIPYYITGQILRLFLEAENQPESMVLMLQKEVAKRIVAADQKESILSISVKIFGEPKYVKTVPAKYFSPAPKVDSAILQITQINKDKLGTISVEKFFETLKKGFAQKRKFLKSNLKCDQAVFEKCGLDPKVRAEDINLDQWRCLAKNI